MSAAAVLWMLAGVAALAVGTGAVLSWMAAGARADESAESAAREMRLHGLPVEPDDIDVASGC